MQQTYILKHNNTPVIEFEYDYERKSLRKLVKIYDWNLLPFYEKESGDLGPCYAALSDWIAHRGISGSRSDYDSIIREAGVDSNVHLSILTLGLNVTDHYWLHKTQYDYKWEDLNFFENNFKELVLRRLFPSDIKDDSSNIHPDFNVDGALIKKWVCDGKDRVLLKEGRTKHNQEPYNEVIASRIAQLWGIDHVDYNLKKLNDKAVSACKCMVDKDTELMTANYVFGMGDSKRDISPYEDFTAVCTRNGLSNVREDMDKMIVLDCLIGNSDRHRNNFGIIRDSNTLKWNKIAPLFDNGNSLYYEHNLTSNQSGNLDSYCKWFKESNWEKLKYIKYPEWYDKKKDTDVLNIVSEELSKNNKIKSERIGLICKNIDFRLENLGKDVENIPRVKTFQGFGEKEGNKEEFNHEPSYLRYAERHE
jgi:hypothetical protein